MVKRMRTKTVNTVREAISVLGGPTAVGAWLGLDQSTVSGWMMAGVVSRGNELPIYTTLMQRGHRINPAIFGVDTWSDLIMPLARVSRRSAARKAA